MEELRLVLNLVRPRYFVPVHGEYRQLAKHARLAEHLRNVGLEETFVLKPATCWKSTSAARAKRGG